MTVKSQNKLSSIDARTDIALAQHIQNYLASNRAARSLSQGLKVVGVGLWPVLDHVTFRALDAEARVEEFTALGYRPDTRAGILEWGHTLIHTFKKKGYPAIVIEQPSKGRKARKGLVVDWLQTFPAGGLHHIAIRVENIEQAVFSLEKQGIAFTNRIAGRRGCELRQVYSVAEKKKRQPFTVLEFVERKARGPAFLPENEKNWPFPPSRTSI